VVDLVSCKHPIQEAKCLEGDMLIKEDSHRPLSGLPDAVLIDI
jgi:hypothetical protein